METGIAVVFLETWKPFYQEEREKKRERDPLAGLETYQRQGFRARLIGDCVTSSNPDRQCRDGEEREEERVSWRCV